MAEKFFEYKGKPLVRSGNTIYYGDMNDAYVVCLTIKNAEDYKDITLAGDITIQLLATDETLSPKKGLFTALDLGATWLERQLKKEA